MSKYGSDDLGFSFGGTDLSNYVDTLNGFDVEAMLQESHAFGDSWVEQSATGIKAGREFTIGGFYDDAASGPNAELQAGTAGEVIITWGSTKTSTFNAIVRSYRRLPTRGELTRFEAIMVPNGAVTEA